MTTTPLCILGMHRSGTSCLAGSLQLAGVQLGEVVESAPHNRKGNRENLEIRDLNDAVLKTSGGAWNSPPRMIRWTADQAARRDEIVGRFESLPGPYWGFKDPRSVLTLPFWQERLPAMRLVVTFRHPLAVARSLAARDDMRLDEGLRLWKVYNRSILDLLEANEPPIVSFDVSASDYLGAVGHVTRHLGIEAPACSSAQDPSFFDATLRHQSVDVAGGRLGLPSDVGEMHARLDNHYRNFCLSHA